jgi:glycosyltransferase involved in cell wall biosynthesis
MAHRGRVRAIIADNALQDACGHFYEYDISVAGALNERGYETVCVSNVDFIGTGEFLPRFHVGFGGPSRNQSFALRAKNKIRRTLPAIANMPGSGLLHKEEQLSAQIYIEDLQGLFRELKPKPEDLIFFPNFSHRDLVALLDFIGSYTGELPAICLMFRRDLFFPSGKRSDDQHEAAVLELDLPKLQKQCGGKLFLFTDTEQLRQEYLTVTGSDFTVLPIPFRHDVLDSVPAQAPHPARTLVYLGGAREEKGFQYLPVLAQELKEELSAGTLRILAQAYPSEDSVIAEAIRDLKSVLGVELIERSLTPEEYYSALVNSDVVFAYYSPTHYRSRSSGVFVEALAAGKPVIVSAGSWMESVLPPGAGVVAKSPEDLPGKVRQLLADYDTFEIEASKAREQVRSKHSPRELVRILLSTVGRG